MSDRKDHALRILRDHSTRAHKNVAVALLASWVTGAVEEVLQISEGWQARAILAETALHTAGFTQAHRLAEWQAPPPLMPAEPAAETPALAVGDRVVLRSGSRPLTLCRIDGETAQVAFWCDKENMLVTQSVAFAALELAK